MSDKPFIQALATVCAMQGWSVLFLDDVLEECCFSIAPGATLLLRRARHTQSERPSAHAPWTVRLELSIPVGEIPPTEKEIRERLAAAFGKVAAMICTGGDAAR